MSSLRLALKKSLQDAEAAAAAPAPAAAATMIRRGDAEDFSSENEYSESDEGGGGGGGEEAVTAASGNNNKQSRSGRSHQHHQNRDHNAANTIQAKWKDKRESQRKDKGRNHSSNNNNSSSSSSTNHPKEGAASSKGEHHTHPHPPPLVLHRSHSHQSPKHSSSGSADDSMTGKNPSGPNHDHQHPSRTTAASSSSSSSESRNDPYMAATAKMEGRVEDGGGSADAEPAAAAAAAKTKKRKNKTVPAPTPALIRYLGSMPQKRSRRAVAPGLRVKVRFATSVRTKDGRTVTKKKWFGGRVSAVSKEGSKIRIRYDDGTSEVTRFPDPDVIVDDADNGSHAVPADKFLPPPGYVRDEDGDGDRDQGGDGGAKGEAVREIATAASDDEAKGNNAHPTKVPSAELPRAGEEEAIAGAELPPPSQQAQVKRKRGRPPKSHPRRDSSSSGAAAEPDATHAAKMADDHPQNATAVSTAIAEPQSHATAAEAALAGQSKVPSSPAGQEKKLAAARTASPLLMQPEVLAVSTANAEPEPEPEPMDVDAEWTAVVDVGEMEVASRNATNSKDQPPPPLGPEENAPGAPASASSKGAPEEVSDEDSAADDALSSIVAEDVCGDGSAVGQEVGAVSGPGEPEQAGAGGFETLPLSSTAGHDDDDDDDDENGHAKPCLAVAKTSSFTIRISAAKALQAAASSEEEEGEIVEEEPEEEDDQEPDEETGDQEEGEDDDEEKQVDSTMTLSTEHDPGLSVSAASHHGHDQAAELSQEVDAQAFKEFALDSLPAGLTDEPDSKPERTNASASDETRAPQLARGPDSPQSPKERVLAKRLHIVIPKVGKREVTVSSPGSEGEKADTAGSANAEERARQVAPSDTAAMSSLSPRPKKHKRKIKENGSGPNDGSSTKRQRVDEAALSKANKSPVSRKRTIEMDESADVPAVPVLSTASDEDGDKLTPHSRSSKDPSIVRSFRRAAHKANERISSRQEVVAGEAPKKKKRKQQQDGDDTADAPAAEAEQEDSPQQDPWVQCDKCGKWRIIPAIVESTLPDTWYCADNVWDPKRASCDAPEQTPKQAAKEKKRRMRLNQMLAAAQAVEEEGEAIVAASARNVDPSSDKTKRPSPIPELSESFSDTQKPTATANSAPDEPVSSQTQFTLPRSEKKTSKKEEDGSAIGPASDDIAVLDKKRGRGRPRRAGGGAAAPVVTQQPKETAATTSSSSTVARSAPAPSSASASHNDDTDNLEWVQCEKCEKWRKLPPHVSADDLPDVWYCSLNTWNPASASCDAPEDKADGLQDVGFHSGSTPGKLTYRSLIFGNTGRKANRPISERARAAESLFLAPNDDEDAPPTVMYANSSCFVARGRSSNNGPDENARIPSVFELMSNSNLWAELRTAAATQYQHPGGANDRSWLFHTYDTLPRDAQELAREIILRVIDDGSLSSEEILKRARELTTSAVLKFFTINVVVTCLYALVKEGLVDCVQKMGPNWTVKDWDPRYRRRAIKSMGASVDCSSSRPPSSLSSSGAHKASRCIKIAKPWKQRDH